MLKTTTNEMQSYSTWLLFRQYKGHFLYVCMYALAVNGSDPLNQHEKNRENDFALLKQWGVNVRGTYHSHEGGWPLRHPKPAVDLWMDTANLKVSQELGGSSWSSTTQEAQEEDSESTTQHFLGLWSAWLKKVCAPLRACHCIVSDVQQLFLLWSIANTPQVFKRGTLNNTSSVNVRDTRTYPQVTEQLIHANSCQPLPINGHAHTDTQTHVHASSTSDPRGIHLSYKYIHASETHKQSLYYVTSN